MTNRTTARVLTLTVLAVVALIAASPGAALAASTYTVDRAVSWGRVAGTIVTNGKAGVLTPADILDWNLAIKVDGDPDEGGRLLGPLSGANSTLLAQGGALTASPDGLFFDFARNSGYPMVRGDFPLFQIITPDSAVAWQLQGDIFNDEMIRETDPNTQIVVFHGLTAEQIAVGGPSYPLGLSLNRVRVREETEGVLRIRGHFTPDACGDGVDPATEPVSLVVSTPIATVYPTSPDPFPILPGEFELVEDTAGRRWQLTAAAIQRTGIERFDIDALDGTVVFLDRHTTLPDVAFQHLTVELTVGNDAGRAEGSLVEAPSGSGRWRVGR